MGAVILASLKVEISYCALKRHEDVGKVFLPQLKEVETTGVTCAARLNIELLLLMRLVLVLIAEHQVVVGNLERV